MGTRYTTIAISGYNASPPADDGTEIESNKVKWSTIKTKLDDPIKTRQDAIDAALVAFADLGPIQKSTAYTTTIADHLKTIEVTGTTPITLGAVGSMGAGYTVTIRNVGVATVTVDGSAAETIDGDANFTLAAEQAVTVQVNAAASGYITVTPIRAGITDTAGSSQIAVSDSAVTITPNTIISGTLGVTGAVTLSSTLAASNGGSLTGTWSDLGTVTTIDINGGTLDGVTINSSTIGGTTAAAGTFTDLTSTGNTTIGNALGDSLTFHPSTWTLSNDINLTGANVGINTVPATYLHVARSGTGEIARFESTTDSTPQITIYTNSAVRTILRGSTAETALLSQGALPLILGTNNTTRLTISGTGAHTIAAPTSAAVALSITGYANQDTVSITADSTSGQSKGVLIKGGTTSADYSARFQNQAGTATYLDVDGAGNVVVSNAALATTATDGFLYIPSSAGTPTGTPTTKTGRVPIEIDTTNDALMIYDGSWKALHYRSRGALVSKSASQTLTTGVSTAINFNAESYDTDSIHDNVTNNTRLTVPTGVTKVRLIGSATFAANATGVRQLLIRKNNSSFIGRHYGYDNDPQGSIVSSLSAHTSIVEVTGGDYFELHAYQNSGGNLDVTAVGGDTLWFSMEIIE